MKAETAIGLIAGLKLKDENPQFWLDLGAGEGTFTKALAHLLPANSAILAIDQSSTSLRKIPAQIGSIRIRTLEADFSAPPQGLSRLDGNHDGKCDSLH